MKLLMAFFSFAEAQPVPDLYKSGILVRNDTLYWSVSPMMTIADLGVMRKKIGEFGGDFMVQNLELDPSKKFITAITVFVKSESGSTGLGSAKGGNHMPITHYAGYLIKNGLCIGSNFIPEPLSNDIRADYQQAVALYKQNEIEFISGKNAESEYETNGITFSRALLEGKASDAILERSGVGKSGQNTFLVTAMHRNTNFYINTKKVNAEDLSALPFEKVVKVEIKKDKLDRKYLIVHSN